MMSVVLMVSVAVNSAPRRSAARKMAMSGDLVVFEIAFRRPTVADSNSFEQWRDDGGKHGIRRANETWGRMLRDYEALALELALDVALQAFIANARNGCLIA